MHLKYLLPVLIISGLTACNKTDAPTATEQASVAPKQMSTATNTATPTPPKTRQYNAEVINFEGFGPAKFGDNEESVRMSWGRPLVAGKPAKGATCYYLYKEAIPQQNNGIAFMLEDGKFVRYDVDDASIVAPGGIVVGDTAAAVLAAHTDHVTKAPHKYIQGAQTLTVTPSHTTKSDQNENARLIFEADSSGTIVHWRIGVAPQVYYVEGCS